MYLLDTSVVSELRNRRGDLGVKQWVAKQGEEVLAQIAREVAVMRRDIRTDWSVRDDVRAKLRSAIKRLLVRHKYPPDKRPEAIRLVIEQMESMAPHDGVAKASTPSVLLEPAGLSANRALYFRAAGSRWFDRADTSPSG